MSDLLYAGKTMDYIAGLTPWHRWHVLYLPRDKYGRLDRRDPDLPPGVEVDEDGHRIISKPVHFQDAFKRVNRERGLTHEQTEQAWQQYRDDNPNMGKAGRQRGH